MQKFSRTSFNTCLKTNLTAATQFGVLQIVCVRPVGWKRTRINHLHHGAATVTSKTGEEVMEKRKDILGQKLDSQQFFLWKMQIYGAKNKSK